MAAAALGPLAIPMMIGGAAVSAAGTIMGGQAADRRAGATASAIQQSGDASLTGARMSADAILESGLASEKLGVMTSEALRSSGAAAEDAGNRAQQSYEFKAAQEIIASKDARATGQRAAFEKDRDTRLLLSRLQARAAASGGSADDPSILALAGQIASRGEYSALTDMYAGETRALGLEDMAVSDRMTGAAVQSEGRQKHIAAWDEANARLFEGRSKYEAAAAEAKARLYAGTTQRDSSYTQAELTRQSGSDQRTASYFSGASTILSGVGSAYRTYGGDTERRV